MKHVITLITLLISFVAWAQQKNTLAINLPANHAGNYNEKLFNDSLASSFVIIVPKEVKLHKHEFHSEHVYVVSGEATMKLGNETLRIKPGDVIFIPKGIAHKVEVTSKEPLKVISIQAPFFNGTDRVMLE